jgi:hypothetical protein
MKILFIPFSIVGGLVAGQIGKKVFDQIWGVFDDEEPPKSKHREATWAKVLIAAALEGAIFKGTRALVDRGSRTAFQNTLGTWPGEDRPEPE